MFVFSLERERAISNSKQVLYERNEKFDLLKLLQRTLSLCERKGNVKS